jgi:hypothetical protein
MAFNSKLRTAADDISSSSTLASYALPHPTIYIIDPYSRSSFTSSTTHSTTRPLLLAMTAHLRPSDTSCSYLLLLAHSHTRYARVLVHANRTGTASSSVSTETIPAQSTEKNSTPPYSDSDFPYPPKWFVDLKSGSHHLRSLESRGVGKRGLVLIGSCWLV